MKIIDEVTEIKLDTLHAGQIIKRFGRCLMVSNIEDGDGDTDCMSLSTGELEMHKPKDLIAEIEDPAEDVWLVTKSTLTIEQYYK